MRMWWGRVGWGGLDWLDKMLRALNLVFSTPGTARPRIRRGPRHIQYLSHLIGDCLGSPA